jgi:hypothetical protein
VEIDGGRRTRRFYLRLKEDEALVIRQKAKTARVSISEFIRRAAMGRVIMTVSDRQMIGEIRRLGAMIKHLYPSTITWTDEEKERYWRGYEQLMKLAARMDGDSRKDRK